MVAGLAVPRSPLAKTGIIRPFATVTGRGCPPRALLPTCVRVLSFLFAASLLAGCTVLGSAERDVSTPRPPAAIAGLTGCPRDLVSWDTQTADLSEGAIPAGFVPRTVVRCYLNLARQVAETDLYTVTETRAPSTPSPMEALALPDREFVGSGACPAYATSPVAVLLMDRAGRTVRVHLPEDACGRPRAAVAAELSALTYGKPVRYLIKVRR